MVKQLGEIDEELQFCWYTFTDETSMKELFISINKDYIKINGL